jgi:2-C-methyl-D-erythritol 2,4-cyclodiphosphate synthase
LFTADTILPKPARQYRKKGTCRPADVGWRAGGEIVTIGGCPRGAVRDHLGRTGGRAVRVGFGHDTHRLEDGRPLILGGVAIDHPRGLVGHSDADVVIHAVADAVLGASGLGDIGEHYPDTDPRWRGLPGDRLLREVVIQAARAGWVPVNCDLVVHAQEPKLGPHKAAIRRNVATLLGVEPGAVNVKAKTGEHLGPVGRGEAVVCEAVVLLEPIPTA